MTICPRCNQALDVRDYEGVEVPACAHCDGHWLTPAELKQIIDSRAKTWEPGALAAAGGRPPYRVPARRLREDLLCPNCGASMESYNYAGDSGVILDRCLQCGGIWLDGGELELVQMTVQAADLSDADDERRLGWLLRREELRQDKLERLDEAASPMPEVALVNRSLNPDEIDRVNHPSASPPA